MECPPCPKCHQPMTPFGRESELSRWWTCACHRQTYLMHGEGWGVLWVGTD